MEMAAKAKNKIATGLKDAVAFAKGDKSRGRIVRPKAQKMWALVHPGAPGGVVLRKPRRRKQDKRATAADMYAVVFFPRIDVLGKARVGFYEVRGTLSNSPEAAKTRFMDGIAKGEKWETYAEAGHRVRRVRISDMGDA
jgi:hypothetical protein